MSKFFKVFIFYLLSFNYLYLVPIFFSNFLFSDDQDQSSLSIEEVIVTARKKSENLQSVPISITALTASQIEDSFLPDINSLDQLVPNLSMTTSTEGSGSTVQAFIRGIGEADFAPYLDPGVGIYVDGVYLARTMGSNLEFNDIERISVLRGPQGTLFGRNTIGGAINIVTREPSGNAPSKISITTGEYGYIGFSGYSEASLSESTSASIAVLSKQSDGWQKRDNADNGGNHDMMGARAHLVYVSDDNFKSHLIFDTTTQDQQTQPNVLADFDGTQIFPSFYNGFVASMTGSVCCTPNKDIDRSSNSNLTKDEVDTFGFSWTNSWDLGSSNFKSITGYRDLESEQFRDSDNSPLPFFSVGTQIEHDQTSQEFVFSGTSNNDSLEWVLGAYYFQEDTFHGTDVTVGEGLFQSLSALPFSITLFPGGPPLAFLAIPFDLSLRFDRNQKVTSKAVYAHSIYSVTDELRLTLAARYTKDEKEMSMFSLKRASQVPIIAPGATDEESCGDVRMQGKGSIYNCSNSWSEFSPKIGIDYQVNDDVMTYFHVSKGFRSGVFNARPLAPNEVSSAEPETLTSYEVGFKSQWYDNRFQLNGSIFNQEYENQQFLVNRSSDSAQGALALIVENAAESSALGFELDFLALINNSLTLRGGISHIDPEYDSFQERIPDPNNAGSSILNDVSDRPFRFSPDWTANLGLEYTVPIASTGGTLRLHSHLAYKGQVYYSFDRAASSFDLFDVDGFTTVNAGLTYISSDQKWEISAYGKNLSDKRSIIGGFGVDAFGSTDVRYSDPRIMYLGLKYMTD